MATRTRRRPLDRWQTVVDTDFSQGIFRDPPRAGIPPGGVYDALDMLLHRPGVAVKRGGTEYGSDALTSATYAQACVYAPFLIGSQLVAVGDGGNVYKIVPSSGAVTNMTGSIPYMIEKPKFFIGGSQSIVVFTSFGGGSLPWFYDGELPPQQFIGGRSKYVDGEKRESVYVLTITGTPTGGSFALDLTGQPGHGTPNVIQVRTGTLAYNISAATLQTALNNALAAASVTEVTFSCTGGSLPGTAITITAPAGWGVTYIPPTLSGLTLTGGSSPVGSITNSLSGLPTGEDGTSVPQGRFVEPHLERLVIANEYDLQQRMWFSPLMNVTSTPWDIANAWIDMPVTISGLCSIMDNLIVFSTQGMWVLTGTIPPPARDTDMRLDPISEVGCTDARSITRFENTVVFANPKGVYVTAGAAPVPLMEGKIQSYWRSLFDGYTPSADGGAEWCISTGVYGGRFLFVTVLNVSGTLVETLMYDFGTKAWVRLSNIRARMYATAHAFEEELYFASRATNRIVKLSGLFSPTSSNKNDADGTAVTCQLQPRPPAAGNGLKAFGDARVLYDMRDAASDNPTMAVQVAAGVEATSFANVAESPLAETTDLVRKGVTVSKDSLAVHLKLQQSNASSKTEVYGVEYDVRPYTSVAGGQ